MTPIGETERALFLEEVRRAEEKFHGGYVGANYFVTRWASEILEEAPESRRRMLDALVEDGRVQVYEAPDGKKAIRLTGAASPASMRLEGDEGGGRNDDDES